MGKGRDLTAHQQGIVRRYYEHLDTVTIQRLQELVSDLAVADERGAPRLWERARQTLVRAKVEPGRIERTVGRQNLEELARLVGELACGGKAGPGGRR